MIYPDPLFRLSDKGRRRARGLMWLSIAAGLLHLAGAFLIDPAAYLAQQYGQPNGIGILIDDFPSAIESAQLVDAIGIAAFLIPAAIYISVGAVAHALSQGQTFDSRVFVASRRFAWTVVAVALAGVVFNTLASIVRLPGDSDATLYLMISSGQLVSLFLGVTLVALVSILGRAKLIAEDSAAIV